MTIVFTGILSPLLITVTVDSAVRIDFEDHREYDTGRKAFWYPGVGCVATWGAREHNRIGDFLDKHKILPDTHSVKELADLVNRYLIEEYRPQELNLDDVGYHVTGFDRNGNAYLSHVFWGFDRPTPPEQTEPTYHKYDHTVEPGRILLYYNGRNDLAETVIKTLIEKVRGPGSDTHFNLVNPIHLARFGDFIVRFAAELTPEVAPPILTYLISVRNESALIKNTRLCPVSRGEVEQALIKLGYQNTENL